MWGDLIFFLNAVNLYRYDRGRWVPLYHPSKNDVEQGQVEARLVRVECS
jgi:hypothetical protein